METKPQFLENEEIALGKIKLKNHQNYLDYKSDFSINFDGIAFDKLLNFQNGERYFSIGYPFLPHYDENIYANEPNFPLIKEIGIGPLFKIYKFSKFLQNYHGTKPSRKI